MKSNYSNSILFLSSRVRLLRFPKTSVMAWSVMLALAAYIGPFRLLIVHLLHSFNRYGFQYPNEVGLLQNCPFEYFPWTTCYGCPVEPPSPANPVPAQATTSGQALRHRLPLNCSTPFWDPIGGKCLCSDSQCQFNDETKSIGPNGQNVSHSK